MNTMAISHTGEDSPGNISDISDISGMPHISTTVSIPSIPSITIITGHYGSGKTNFALNLSQAYQHRGRKVSLCDIDIVNPYFRSADFAAWCKATGIRLISPPFANTNLDTPVLTAQVDGAITNDDCVILDVGGDDAGATALGRYEQKIISRGTYQMILVVNQYRPLTRNPEDVVEMIADINRASKLQITHIVNNSNLGPDTTEEHILSGLDYADKIIELSGIPLLYHVIPRKLLNSTSTRTGLNPTLETLHKEEKLFPVEIMVKAPWA